MTSNQMLAAFFCGCVTLAGLASSARAELRHHWRLDERSGLVAADVASGGEGALVGFGNNDDSHWVEGKLNGALSLGTGSTLRNHVSVNLPAMNAAASGGFTIMMWVNPGDIVARPGEYQLFTSPGDVVGFTIFNDTVDGRAHSRVILFWDGAVPNIILGVTRLTPGTWYHVAVTSTGVGGERQLYVNGAVQAKRFFRAEGGVDSGHANGWGAGDARIGAFNSGGGRWHNSSLDDVRIYDTALSAEEVAEVFSEEPPRELFMRANADADADTNLTDVIFTLNHLFLGGPEPSCLDAADADDDGQLNLTDAVFSLNFQFLGGSAPDAPGPSQCGTDPTADDLNCESFDPCNAP